MIDRLSAVTVVIHGTTVVDRWGGWADQERVEPWPPETLTNVWSTAKGLVAICGFNSPKAATWTSTSP
ncbi:serine hydrolase [Amycolatopsis sp. NPDC004368]